MPIAIGEKMRYNVRYEKCCYVVFNYRNDIHRSPIL